MIKSLLALCGLALCLTGCMPSIQFSETSPNITNFHPKTVLVLPFTNAVGAEIANTQTDAKVVKVLEDSKYFARVIPPAAVKAAMMNDNSLIDVITKFRTVWTATGQMDPKVVAKLGGAFGADSIVFGEVTAWAESANMEHHIYDAGLALRWVDVASGEAEWKCSENLERISGNPCIFDCSSASQTMDLVLAVVVPNWPEIHK